MVNRKRTNCLALSVVTALLTLGPSQPAWADAGPPERPPGSSVSPGEFVTHVQMVSEEVLLVIEANGSAPESTWNDVAADQMIGRVDASFFMRNQGESEEAFDIWFPLGYSDVTAVENFQAWVNGVPAQIKVKQRKEKRDYVPWATWPAVFPLDQDVILRVTYDVRPDGYSPYGTFPYILETGAGWWGTIGEGTITFRLPYEVNKTNTVLNPDVYAGEHVPWVLPNPADFAITGTDVEWHFTDLEPTAEDNVALTVLAPAVWGGIVAARQGAIANPDDAVTQLRLARALDDALYFKYGLVPIGNSTALAEEVEALYQRALELAPREVEIFTEYLEWLYILTPPLGPLPANLRPTLERALELAPDDGRLLEIQDWIAQMEPCVITPTPAATATSSPTPTETPVPLATATVTDTPAPTATATPLPTATATATLSPTLTPEPTATATPLPTQTASATIAPPTPEPESGGDGGICPGVMVIALVPFIFVGARQGQRRLYR